MTIFARATPRYTVVAQALHWLLALALTGIVVLGLVMTHVKLAPALQFKLYQLHKSVGITILILAALRLLWRLTHTPPPPPNGMPMVEKLSAHAAHVVLYALMIGLPLVGWSIVSLSSFNLPTVLYGVLPWPHISALTHLPKPEKMYWEGVAKFVHAYGAYLLIALVALHALAALRHHFVLRDDVLQRMLPRFGRTKNAVLKV